MSVRLEFCRILSFKIQNFRVRQYSCFPKSAKIYTIFPNSVERIGKFPCSTIQDPPPRWRNSRGKKILQILVKTANWVSFILQESCLSMRKNWQSNNDFVKTNSRKYFQSWNCNRKHLTRYKCSFSVIECFLTVFIYQWP